jgi:hypothetical protein
MRVLPDVPPHVVVDKLIAVAKEHGYFFRKVDIVYYDGVDQYLTEVSRLDTISMSDNEV